MHCIVIGAGIGGLAAGALLARKGMQVAVFEAREYPGGCAGTFGSGRYRFDAGATVGCGFQPGGPMDRLGRELGISWPVLLEPVAWQYRHAGLRVDLDASRRSIIDRFPLSGPFWAEQSRLAGVLWRLAEDGLPWPPASTADLPVLLRKAAAGFPSSPGLFKLAYRSAYDWLASYGLDRDPAFVRMIDAQLLISAQATSMEANALNAAIALDLPVSGAYRVDGGMGRIAGRLVESIERDGGAVLYGKKAVRIDAIGRDALGIETADGDAIAADLVLANLTPDSFELLDGRQPGNPGLWSAFMLYLGMDDEAVRQAGVDHLQIVAADGELGEGRSIFVSASPADDRGRAPDGLRAVTVSTHTRPGAWFEALRNGREAYAEMKERYTGRVLELMQQGMPEARGAVRSVTAATPVSWERWTGRHGGCVGGYPQTSLFGVRGPKTRYDNLFLVGDSIFPGQSLPGVATGARRVVELAMRHARKIIA